MARGRKGGRRKRSTGPLRRLLGLLAFLPVASRAPTYTRLIWALLRDDRTPAARKGLLAGALGYLVLGRDLIPDQLPIIGGLDDVVVIVLAVDLFLDGVPVDVLHEKLDELEIDRDAFEHDMAQVRRLVPGPLRRGFRRLPSAIGFGARAAQESGVGARLRTWITSPAPTVER